MAKYKKMREVDSNYPVWAARINELLNETDTTQQELSERSGVSAATISDWIGTNKKDKPLREPKIIGFKAVADGLGVSTDYLLGLDQCKVPEDEEIHKITGLSDDAINNLKNLQASVSSGDAGAEKKAAICNYLIETVHESPFFENLYDYLFGEFYFENKNGGRHQGAELIISKSPSGKESKSLAFNDVFSHAHLAMVHRDLSNMKNETDEIRAAKENANQMTEDDLKEMDAMQKDLWDTEDALEAKEDKK